MGNRHQSRVLALQFLFQQDLQINVVRPLGEALAAFWGMQTENQASTMGFAEELARGAVERLSEIDARIKAYSENWDFHRIAVVDRNILRLAIYEMLFRPDIPPVVSINEAIELAKMFSTEDSGRFVNGILDRVKLDLSRPLRTGTANHQK